MLALKIRLSFAFASALGLFMKNGNNHEIGNILQTAIHLGAMDYINGNFKPPVFFVFSPYLTKHWNFGQDDART